MNQRLGQHFLKNTKALHALIAALAIRAGDTIIEIGPGHGELTAPLLASSAEKIIAIEKDARLAYDLKNMIHDSRFTIHEDDVLKILPIISRELVTPYKLAGNIPYYITGFLFRAIEKLAHKPSRAVFMIQKEVAERVCEAPPRMNKLAASVQMWAEPHIIMTLSPTNFDPPPQVDSAIIVLDIRNNVLGIRKLHAYYRMVNILFRQPRKTIINNLTFGLPEISKGKLLDALAAADVNPINRPHNISVEKIKGLSLKLLKIQ